MTGFKWALLLLGVPCLASAITEADEEHPISGVIKMLEDLQVQAKEEGAEEAGVFQEYSKWCTDVRGSLTEAIAGHKSQIEVHEDSIAAAEKDILTLERNIAKLDKEITRRMAAQEKADENRKEEESDYDEEQADLNDTLDTMNTLIKALDMLVKSKKDANAAASSLLARKAAKHALRFLQVMKMSEEQEKQLTDFVNSVDSPTDKKKVGGADMQQILDLVKSLQVNFEKMRDESVKEETQAKNNYNIAKQAQDYAISTAEEAKGEKETILGDRKSDLADLKADLADESSLRDSETANLKAHDAGCATKTEEWDTRSKIRAGELKAMVTAVEILERVTHVRNPDTYEKREHEGSGPESFLQIDDPRMKAVNLLKAVALKRHSKSLAKLASDVAKMRDDSFDKMNSMIQKMIFRLMAEQKDEDDHKNWCDSELEQSTTSKESKDNRMEMLNSKIDTAKANIAELTQAITDNEDTIAAITKYVEEETKIRSENKFENEAAIKDSSDAKNAVDKAIKVLTNFYKESGMIAKKDWEFVQTGKKDIDLPEEPSTWDSSYTGVNDPKEEGNGVIALLEATGEKFATMEADVRAQEESDNAAFQKDMTEQAMEKAARETDTNMKTNRKTEASQKLDGMETSKKHLTTELDAVNQYLKDLEPACVSGDSSYEDRKKARSDEIEALRKSQNILADAFKPEAGFLQQKKLIRQSHA